MYETPIFRPVTGRPEFRVVTSLSRTRLSTPVIVRPSRSISFIVRFAYIERIFDFVFSALNCVRLMLVRTIGSWLRYRPPVTPSDRSIVKSADVGRVWKVITTGVSASGDELRRVTNNPSSDGPAIAEI